MENKQLRALLSKKFQYIKIPGFDSVVCIVIHIQFININNLFFLLDKSCFEVVKAFTVFEYQASLIYGDFYAIIDFLKGA